MADCPYELVWSRQFHSAITIGCTDPADHGGPHVNVEHGVRWGRYSTPQLRIHGSPADMDLGMLVELTDEQRQALPARFHKPHFDDLGTPHSWICEVCWGEGWQTSWPCGPALSGGTELARALGLRRSS